MKNEFACRKKFKISTEIATRDDTRVIQMKRLLFLLDDYQLGDTRNWYIIDARKSNLTRAVVDSRSRRPSFLNILFAVRLAIKLARLRP